MRFAGKIETLGFGCALIAALLLAGCPNEAKEQARITEIQKKADEKIAKAESEAKERIATAEQKLKQALDDASAKAKADSDEAISKAQASADEQSKAVEEALKMARAGYKAEARLRLADLNKKTQDVATKSAKASAAAKKAVNTLMQKIATEQKAVYKDISAFDAATLETLPTIKTQLDKDLAALKATIATAAAKVH
jgi:hypothetical protein